MMKKRRKASVKAWTPTHGIETPSPYMNSGVPGLFGGQQSATPELEGMPQGLLSRMGGIDGIMSMIGQAQKYYGMYRQVNSLLSMFGSLGGATAATRSLPMSRLKKQGKRTKR